jgi:hypothetical protein
MRALFLFFSEGVKTVAVLFLFACGFFLSGCSSSTPKSEIGIYLADDIRDFYGYCPTLEVDIVGLNDVEQKRLLGYDVDLYFQPPEQFRKSLRPLTAKFSEENMTAKILDNDDPIWSRWNDKGVTFIAFIVNLPTVSDLKDKATDARKLIVDINKRTNFMRASTHNIMVGGSGIVDVKNPPKDAKREPLLSQEAVEENAKKEQAAKDAKENKQLFGN